VSTSSRTLLSLRSSLFLVHAHLISVLLPVLVFSCSCSFCSCSCSCSSFFLSRTTAEMFTVGRRTDYAYGTALWIKGSEFLSLKDALKRLELFSPFLGSRSCSCYSCSCFCFPILRPLLLLFLLPILLLVFCMCVYLFFITYSYKNTCPDPVVRSER